ncbi:MAG: response regulator [Endomicrobiales bacterium]
MEEYQRKVLLIEDELETCRAIAECLKMRGDSIDYVHSGEAGIKYLEEHPNIEIVLLDINLGHGIDGFSTLEIIRNKFKYVQVIMSTGESGLQSGIKAMQKGASDYISKPFKSEEYCEKASRAIKLRESEILNDIYSELINNDIRNLLGCFQDSLSMLTEKSGNKNKPVNPDALRLGVKQLMCLVNNVHMIRKYEEHILTPYITEFYLKSELEEELKPLLDKYKDQLKVTYNKYEEGHKIKTDRELLMQVFWNLLFLNVWTAETTTVNVIINEQMNGLDITVRYAGFYSEPLMDPDIFNKYSYISHKTDSSNPNMALGLTYCKYITDLLGSEIKVHGDTNAKETIFSFTVKNLKTEGI